MKSYQQFLSLFDLPGGVVLGLFSIEMIAAIAYSYHSGTALSAIHRDIYLGVVSAFALNRTAKVFKGIK